MFVEVIYKPISGQYPEKHFGNVSSNCLWVKFTTKEYQDWVGSFQQGWDGDGTFILNLDKQEKAFVVAGGRSYLIDLSSKELLNKQQIIGTKSAISNEDQTIIYFSGGYNLQFIDMNGSVSVLFDGYYFDDIVLTEIKHNRLYAKYWYYQRDTQPFHFEINLLTKEVKDSYFENGEKE